MLFLRGAEKREFMKKYLSNYILRYCVLNETMRQRDSMTVDENTLLRSSPVSSLLSGSELSAVLLCTYTCILFAH